MSTYRINSECGLMHIEADTAEEAKGIYSLARDYDFDDARATDGSWYWIESEGEIVDEFTDNMP